MKTNNYYKQPWEYLLMVIPPEHVKKSICTIKKELSIKHGCTACSSSNIILAGFLLSKDYERYMLNRLFEYFISSIAFEIELNKYGVFPYHTLYAGVNDGDRLKKLEERLFLTLAGTLPVRENRSRVPKKHCLSLARNLSMEQFGSISGEYRNKKLRTSFRLKNIVLLKRVYSEYNSGGRWSGYNNFTVGY